MNLASNILLFCLFLIIPFSEILRFSFNNGLALSALDIVSGGILIFTIIRFIKNRTNLSDQLYKPIIFFISICIVSLLVNIFSLTPFHVLVSSLYILRWLSLTSLYFFITSLNERIKTRVPYYLIFSGFLVVIFGFLQYFLYPNLKTLTYLGWDEHYLRLFSTFFDPNFAGIFMVLSFLFSLHLWIKTLEKKEKKQVIVFGILNILTCIAIFLTLSRDTFIALGVSLLTYLMLQANKKYFSIFGTVVFLFAFFIFFLSKLPTEGAHMFRIPSSVARITQAKRALTIFSEHPIFGVGFNAYRYAQLKHGYLDPKSWEASHAAAGTDNSFLFVLATTGVMGFVAYVYLLYRIFKTITYEKKSEIRNLKSETNSKVQNINDRNQGKVLNFDIRYSNLRIVTIASLTAIIISSLFVNSLFYPPILAWMWILIGLTENR